RIVPPVFGNYPHRVIRTVWQFVYFVRGYGRAVSDVGGKALGKLRTHALRLMKLDRNGAALQIEPCVVVQMIRRVWADWHSHIDDRQRPAIQLLLTHHAVSIRRLRKKGIERMSISPTGLNGACKRRQVDAPNVRK